MRPPTLLLVGLGHLGGVLLELLAREEWIGRIVVCTRDRARGQARVNLARLGAGAQGLSPRLEYQRADVYEQEAFAETIAEVAPQIILGTATMQTWWLPERLPAAARAAIEKARFGMWLPCHLAPTHSLMEAVRTSGFTGIVLTAPFPDVVNTILGRIDLAPTAGIGNVDELATKVRILAADRLSVSPGAIEVQLVAHHALERFAFEGASSESAPPFHLRVAHAGTDVTRKMGADDLLLHPYPVSKGPTTAFFTAGSTIRLIRALFRGEPTTLHVPAPAGLPGGYPVEVKAGTIELQRIDGLDLDEAIAINERSQPFDGIHGIEEDGAVVFEPESAAIMNTELGYDCPRMAPDEARARGQELIERFRDYAARHGIDLQGVL